MTKPYYNHHEANKHFKHHSAEYEEGVITVTSSGNVKITLDFKPDEIIADFIDDEPNGSCCDVSVPDEVTVTLGDKTFGISWTIKSARRIKWCARTLKK